jgi:hypothetical protein
VRHVASANRMSVGGADPRAQGRPLRSAAQEFMSHVCSRGQWGWLAEMTGVVGDDGWASRGASAAGA